MLKNGELAPQTDPALRAQAMQLLLEQKKTQDTPKIEDTGLDPVEEALKRRLTDWPRSFST